MIDDWLYRGQYFLDSFTRDWVVDWRWIAVAMACLLVWRLFSFGMDLLKVGGVLIFAAMIYAVFLGFDSDNFFTF